MQLRNSLLTALGASAAMVLFLYSMQFGQFGSHPFVSESNAVALTFFFLAWAAVADAARGRAASARPPWVLVTFGLVMAAACAFCKISVGAVCLGTGVYLLVRTHARSIAIYPVTAAGVVVWVVLVHTFIYRFGAEYINIADPVGWDVRGLVTRYSRAYPKTSLSSSSVQPR